MENLTAKDIEQAYADASVGTVQPDAMWASGKTMKELGAKTGNELFDVEGNPLIDGELYCITREGIFLSKGV